MTSLKKNPKREECFFLAMAIRIASSRYGASPLEISVQNAEV